MSQPISLCNVSAEYRTHSALQGVTGTFAPGTLTAMIGPNGAGKSTLLKAIVGDVRLTNGTVDLGGMSVRSLAYLPQVAAIDRRFPLSVGDVVLLGLWRKISAVRGASPADREAVGIALRTVGLAGFETRAVGALSVGQFQRVLFARLLLQDAAVILLDEPFAAVDDETAEELLTIVQGWHGEGRTVVAVLHNLAHVRRFFPQTLLLARRVVGWGRTDDVLSPDNMGSARALAGRWSDNAAFASAS